MFFAQANEDTRTDQGYFDNATSSTWEAVQATADEAWKQSPLSSLMRMDEFRRAEAQARENEQMVTLEKLNEQYGDLGLKFAKEEYQSVADLMADRKRAELRRKAILEQSDDSLTTTGLRLATGLAVSMADPINIAASFVPVVREARFARMVSSIGVNKARVARGAIEGAVGAAMVEPIVLAAAMQEQADYDLADTMMNITFGTVMGGGLHMGAGKIKDVVDNWKGNLSTEERSLFFNALKDDGITDRQRSRMADQLERLKPETRAAMLRVAVAQASQGNPIRVAALADLDPNVRKEMFDTARVMDHTLDKPLGPANEVVAVLEAHGFEKALLEKGPAIEKDGEVKVTGRALKRETDSSQGYGMVKIIWRHGENSPKAGTSEQVLKDDIFHTPAVLKAEAFDDDDSHSVWYREREDGEIVKYVLGKRDDKKGRVVSIHVLNEKEKAKLKAEGNHRRGFTNGILKRDTASSPSSAPPNSSADHGLHSGGNSGILSQDTESLRSDGQPIRSLYNELAENSTKSDMHDQGAIDHAKEYLKTAPEEIDLEGEADQALEEVRLMQERKELPSHQDVEVSGILAEIEQETKKSEGLMKSLKSAVNCLLRS